MPASIGTHKCSSKPQVSLSIRRYFAGKINHEIGKMHLSNAEKYVSATVSQYTKVTPCYLEILSKNGERLFIQVKLRSIEKKYHILSLSDRYRAKTSEYPSKMFAIMVVVIPHPKELVKGDNIDVVLENIKLFFHYFIEFSRR